MVSSMLLSISFCHRQLFPRPPTSLLSFLMFYAVSFANFFLVYPASVYATACFIHLLVNLILIYYLHAHAISFCCILLLLLQLTFVCVLYFLLRAVVSYWQFFVNDFELWACYLLLLFTVEYYVTEYFFLLSWLSFYSCWSIFLFF